VFIKAFPRNEVDRIRGCELSRAVAMNTVRGGDYLVGRNQCARARALPCKTGDINAANGVIKSIAFGQDAAAINSDDAEDTALCVCCGNGRSY